MIKILKNGARVLSETQTVMTGCGGVVLADRGEGSARYVTWRIDSAGNAFWGHYHDTLTAARSDYCERIAGLTSLL